MRKIIKTGIIFLSLIGFVFALFLALYINKNIDFSVDEALFKSTQGVYPTRFFAFDDAGNAVEFYSIYNLGERREWLEYESINENIKNAFVATEDRAFFEHSGVDVKRTAYALFNSVFHVTRKFGASTITQQLIKNISGDNDNTYRRKFDEIIRALHLERNHSKEEIFELYLNIVPMGYGISGVNVASRFYFGKDVSELSLSECALIAGITNAPSRLNPYSNLDLSIERRNVVLLSMYECGYISEKEYKAAKSENVVLNDSRNQFTNIYPWFVEAVCDDVMRDLQEKNGLSQSAARLFLASGGLDVYTTMDMEIQGVLDEIFSDDTFFSKDDKLNCAMTVYDSKSGLLKGIIGNRGEKSASRIKNYARELMIPGSSIKPLSLYAPLLDSGKYNWSSIFDDSPTSFVSNGDETVEYPKNYPRVYKGNITLVDALCDSKNTVASRIYEIINKEKVFKALKGSLKFDSLVEQMTLENGSIITDISLAPMALGQLTRGITLSELTEAYSVFLNDGKYVEGRSYYYVSVSQGQVLLETAKTEKQVFSPESARIMALMLCEVVNRGTAKAINLKYEYETGGKTGTSGGDKDRIFVGFTPYYLAGIWMGYADNKTAIGKRDVSHLEIWDVAMQKIHEVKIDDDEPEILSREGLLYIPYCKDSGKLYSESCMHDLRGDRLDWGYFTKNNRPTGLCETHIICYYNEKKGKVSRFMLPGYKKCSLLDIEIRTFPIAITVEDEKYAYNKKSALN